MAGLIITKPELDAMPGKTVRAERIILPEKEFTVGREEGNDLVLAESTVSKYHSSIRWDPTECTFFIEDRGSMNGTIVNKEKITKARLEDGAIIQIGTYVLLFSEKMGQKRSLPEQLQMVKPVETAEQRGSVEPPEEAEPLEEVKPPEEFEPLEEIEPQEEAAENKGKRGAPLFTLPRIVIFALILCCGGYFLFTHVQQIIQDRLSRHEQEVMRAQDELHLIRGAQYHQQQKWEEAIEELGRVSEGFDRYTEVRELIDQATGEIVHRGQYHQVLDALDKDDLPLASSKAADIPPTSVYHAGAAEKIEASSSDALAKLQADGEQFMQRGQWDDAIGAFDKALQLAPGNDTLLALQKTATAKRLYSRSASLYARGQFADAVGTLDAISELGLSSRDTVVRNARNRKALIRELENHYRDGLRFLEQGNEAEAVQSWEALLAREKNLVRARSSQYYRRVSAEMTRHYCTKADREYGEGKLIPAYEYWNKALAIEPDCPDALAGVKQIDMEAMSLYREGCSLATSNNLEQAIINWEIVLTTVPPTHVYHQRALKKLEESEGGS